MKQYRKASHSVYDLKYHRAKQNLGKGDAHRLKPFIVTLLVINPTR
jgi:hypothetical protein